MSENAQGDNGNGAERESTRVSFWQILGLILKSRLVTKEQLQEGSQVSRDYFLEAIKSGRPPHPASEEAARIIVYLKRKRVDHKICALLERALVERRVDFSEKELDWFPKPAQQAPGHCEFKPLLKKDERGYILALIVKYKPGELISKLRSKRGISEEGFAQNVGCTAEDLRKIERGKLSPSPQILTQMAEVLNLGNLTQEFLSRFSKIPRFNEQPPAPIPAARPLQFRGSALAAGFKPPQASDNGNGKEISLVPSKPTFPLLVFALGIFPITWDEIRYCSVLQCLFSLVGKGEPQPETGGTVPVDLIPPAALFGIRLNQARVKKGWSVAELARRAKCAESIINKAESGERIPEKDVVRRLVKALGLTCGPKQELFKLAGISYY